MRVESYIAYRVQCWSWNCFWSSSKAWPKSHLYISKWIGSSRNRLKLILTKWMGEMEEKRTYLCMDEEWGKWDHLPPPFGLVKGKKIWTEMASDNTRAIRVIEYSLIKGSLVISDGREARVTHMVEKPSDLTIYLEGGEDWIVLKVKGLKR